MYYHARSTYDNLEAYLTAAAHQVLDIVPLIQNVAVEYVPQVGYLVVISKAESHLLLTVEHGFDDSENKNSFQFVFQQDDCCYFKHAIVRGMNGVYSYSIIIQNFLTDPFRVGRFDRRYQEYRGRSTKVITD
jgi:hypothetical protein